MQYAESQNLQLFYWYGIIYGSYYHLNTKLRVFMFNW